jgi:hypothetical protein
MTDEPESAFRSGRVLKDLTAYPANHLTILGILQAAYSRHKPPGKDRGKVFTPTPRERWLAHEIAVRQREIHQLRVHLVMAMARLEEDRFVEARDEITIALDRKVPDTFDVAP